MCGRYATTRTAQRLTDDFGTTLAVAEDAISADFNMAPTKQAPLVIARAADDSSAVTRELLTAKWGLVPSWAKDPSIGNKMINARSETVDEKPSFKRAFAKRRAVVPLDGFYEWYQGPDTGAGKPPKQPFFITGHTPDGGGEGLGVAGLYEFWKPKDDPDAEWLVSFTILTTAAEGEDGRLHDRAPWLVAAEHLDAWLDPAPHGKDELFALLHPATPGRLQAWPVSTAVNNVRNNGPELLRPLDAE
ncbi:SOS response-associated peptidase [Aeromicrobium sp. Leaf350]|uniref:SOS response-associated peptidase n=1 Tax=Aeromicrobium sp. Leaf350 TaxID=2876565 RepID=UPI001E405F31|nr:SOS response-associated peptidase [Aeromicrobium sp. Leaf350]